MAIVPGDGPLVFVADLEAPELDVDDRHHLGRVLRLRVGAPIVVGDGAGRWRGARFGPTIEIDGPVTGEPAPRPPISVGFAPVKGDRPEWVVQKLTEAGVDRIVPFLAERSVVRWDGERAARQVERWRRVAREAASQARRAWLPAVADLSSTAALVDEGAALADPGGEPPALAVPFLLIGPEGGWSAAERALATRRVDLGPQVYRAETAALAAGVLLAALRARLVAATHRSHTR